MQKNSSFQLWSLQPLKAVVITIANSNNQPFIRRTVVIAIPICNNTSEVGNSASIHAGIVFLTPTIHNMHSLHRVLQPQAVFVTFEQYYHKFLKGFADFLACRLFVIGTGIKIQIVYSKN